MRSWQLTTKAMGFAAAVLTAGSALSAADHGHVGTEDVAATTVVASAPAVGAPATQPATAADDASARENRDNLPLLGGMLPVSGLVSWTIAHLIRARSGNPVAHAIVAPTETPIPAAAAPVPSSSS